MIRTSISSVLIACSVAIGLGGCASETETSDSSEADVKAATKPAPLATIRLALFDEDDKLMATHNTPGHFSFPPAAEFDLRTGKAKWNDFVSRAPKDFPLRTLVVPSAYLTKDPATSICFTGDPKGVNDTLEKLVGTAFSDSGGFFPKETKIDKSNDLVTVVYADDSEGGAPPIAIPRCAAAKVTPKK